jgi:hypothetical protein
MALNPALEQLIAAKLAHTRQPEWELPITEVWRASTHRAACSPFR